MPELPEVETTRRGIAPELSGRSITGVIIRNGRLRHPIPADLNDTFARQPLLAVERRAKYLLFRFPHGSLLVHLGMSGSLRIVPAELAPEKHDHLDIIYTLIKYNSQINTVKTPKKHCITNASLSNSELF